MKNGKTMKRIKKDKNVIKEISKEWRVYVKARELSTENKRQRKGEGNGKWGKK